MPTSTLGASEAPSPSLEGSIPPTVVPAVSTTAEFNLLPHGPPASSDFEGEIACTGSIGASDPVAVVRLTTADPAVRTYVLRNYVDWGQPRTVCTFTWLDVVQVIDAQHVVIGGGSGGVYAVVDLPDVEYHWFGLPPYTPESASTFLAVSPDLDQVAWVGYRPASEASKGYNTDREIIITTASGDTVVGSLPDEPTGFCGVPQDWSAPAKYSLSGDHLFVLGQMFNTTQNNTLHVFEGLSTSHAVVPPSAGWPVGGHPAWAIWRPGTEELYYRQGNDVVRWTTDGSVEVALPGVPWSGPTFTPDGETLAYWLPAADGEREVFLLDLATDAGPNSIAQTTAGPAFLNDVQLWYRRSEMNHGCAGTEGDTPFIYNIDDGSEAPSVIDDIRGAWPAA